MTSTPGALARALAARYRLMRYNHNVIEGRDEVDTPDIDVYSAVSEEKSIRS